MPLALSTKINTEKRKESCFFFSVIRFRNVESLSIYLPSYSYIFLSCMYTCAYLHLFIVKIPDDSKRRQ